MEELEILQRQLASVRETIAAIEGGAQEYQIANRRISKADLATLYKREAELKGSIARLQDGGTYFAELGRL